MGDRYRHEIKFLCDEIQLKLIEYKIKNILHLDPHTKKDGTYLIRSVYFDTYYHSCFYDNENGVDPRSKFRIRIYDYSEGRIQLEKKSKARNMCVKTIEMIDFDVCMKMLRGETLFEYRGRSVLLDEWIYLRNTSLFLPVILGEYVRTPYVYHLGNVRITFDRNIMVSKDITKIFDKHISRIGVLSNNYHILEVKYDDFCPDIIWDLINNMHLQQTSFSKFYLGCKAIKGDLL